MTTFHRPKTNEAMVMRHLYTLALMLFVAVLLGSSAPEAARAQTAKLAGTVTDAASGEPIPGVNVLLVGTSRGAATDAEGQYSIIDLDLGSFNVRFSSVGYGTKVVESVRLTSDRTKTLDVELSEATVQVEEVVVTAVEPVVDANQTTSRSLLTSETIENLPVSSLDELTDRTASAYEGHVRGSRKFETKTVVEGIDVSDDFYAVKGSKGGNFTYNGERYSSVNRADELNNSLFKFNPSAVEEVTVNSGAKPARYTSASGGVVAVSLKEGRGPISGTFSARVAPQINRPGPDSLGFYYDSERYFNEKEALSGPDADSTDLAKAARYTWTRDKYTWAEEPEMDMRASVGGSITDDWNFFASGQWFQSNGYQPNEFQKRIGGLLKTSYDFSDRTSITAVGIVEDRGLWGAWNNRDYSETWRFYLEGLAQKDGGSYLGSLKLSQQLGDKVFLDAQIYRTFQRQRYGYPDDNGNGYTEQGEDGEFIDFRDPDAIEKYIGTNSSERDKMFFANIGNNFSTTGIPKEGRFAYGYKLSSPVPYSEDFSSTVNGLGLDFTSQVTENHLINAGTELKLRNFDYSETTGIDGLGYTLNGATEPFVPTDYERNPWEFAVYASDRMEYGELIVNLDLRMDVVDRDMRKIADVFYPFNRDTVTIGGRQLARNFFRRGEEVPVDFFFNPSLGVSHPIGETAAMYFSYAHSEQLLPYSQLYSLYEGNHSNNRFYSYVDPEQDPIISDNYEVGIQWEFLPGWGADLNAYMRAIDNYGQVNFRALIRRPEGAPSLGRINRFDYQTSFGYGDARGIEVKLRRRPLSLTNEVSLGLRASYTYASIEEANTAGGNQTSFSGEDRQDLPFENAENFSNYPQQVRGGQSVIDKGYGRRHRGVLRMTAGLPFDFRLGLTSTLESGFRYPRAIGADARDRELLTAPTNYQVDLRVAKTFSFTDRLGLDLYADIINLTDHQNIIAYEQTQTGRFQLRGIPSERLILNDGSPVYGPARSFYFGAELNF